MSDQKRQLAQDVYDTGSMGWGFILLIFGIIFSFTPLGATAIIIGVGGFILIAANLITNKLTDIRLVLQGKDIPPSTSKIEKSIDL